MDKDLKKIKRNIKESTEVFDKLKGLIGASDITTPKTPLDFESEKDFENFCKEYTEKYSIEITQFANKIFLANETKENASELYALLTGGFNVYLLLETLKGS